MRGLDIQQKRMIGGILLSLIVILLTVFYLVNQRDKSNDYPLKRVFKYSFTIKNTTNRFIEASNFWVYKPLPQNGIQKLSNIKTSHPSTTTIDEEGNEKLTFVVKNLPPFGSRVVSITAEMGMNTDPDQSDVDNLERYLSAEKNIESDDPKIRSIAESLKGNSKQETAQKIYEWVNSNLTDAGYIENDHGALYALDSKKGDCTEFMYLYLALARANDIPARGIAGYVKKENAILKPRDYHNWAEIYMDGAWRVVDPLNKTIFKNESHYIAMRKLGKSISDGDDNTQRFFGNDTLIHVSMN